MVARTLQERLTTRLLLLAGTVLVAVAATAVVVTDRLLDASDTTEARSQAKSTRDAIDRELAEGDSPALAEEEVAAAARAEGARIAIVHGGAAQIDPLPALGSVRAGQCTTVDDENGRPLRACATGDAKTTVVAAVSIANHRDAVHAVARGMLVVVLAALALLWLAIRRAIRGPVAELTALVAWTERIAADEAPPSPPAALTREIEKLESAFEALVGRLFVALDRERATSAHVAHELRTPLTAIVVELDAFRSADAPMQAMIGRIRVDALRLADVIDAILLLSNPEKGGAGDAIVNLADVVRRLTPPTARIDAPDEALVKGDERLLGLALRNVLDNAVKYGQGVAQVSLVQREQNVILQVGDRGAGLSEDACAKIFERYWRGAADGEGRGLGLALVREVAERHGGRAGAKRGSEGGLDVSITVPLIAWAER